MLGSTHLSRSFARNSSFFLSFLHIPLGCVVVISKMASAFLQLPLELRLDIYDLALQQENEVTIATMPDPTYQSDIPNLPDGHRPIMVPGFDEYALSFTKFAPQAW